MQTWRSLSVADMMRAPPSCSCLRTGVGTMYTCFLVRAPQIVKTRLFGRVVDWPRTVCFVRLCVCWFISVCVCVCARSLAKYLAYACIWYYSIQCTLPYTLFRFVCAFVCAISMCARQPCSSAHNGFHIHLYIAGIDVCIHLRPHNNVVRNVRNVFATQQVHAARLRVAEERRFQREWRTNERRFSHQQLDFFWVPERIDLPGQCAELLMGSNVARRW